MTGHERIAEKNIINAFNYIVGGYYNCILDGYEEDLPETREDLISEIYESAMTDEYGPGYMGCGKAPKEMRFAGKKFCMNVIETLMNEDGDVEEIAEVKGWN